MRRTIHALGAALGVLGVALCLPVGPVRAASLGDDVDAWASTVTPSVIAARRQIHAHPELGNRETETARFVAERLRALGYEVTTGVAVTGVVGVLHGGKPGPVVALRSELDALPVTEEVDLPFRSRVTTQYAGQTTGVMHACGHDAHMAILLGTAEVLANIRAELPGTVKVIFQPAEEGAPEGEDYGARRMVKEGVLRDAPAPSAIFGLHVMSFADVGTIAYRSGGLMAGSDDFKITVHGRQTHGAMPWGGVDPIVVAAQIVSAIQTIPSRMMDVTQAPIVVTVGSIHGGIKSNIIPDEVTLVGTIRALDPGMLAAARTKLSALAEATAQASGATATVEIDPLLHYDVTYNDPALLRKMLPTLRQVVGEDHLVEAQPTTGGEDFSAFQREIPGLFVILGARTPGANPADFPPNHSPRFKIDERVLEVGVRTLSHLAVDYLSAGARSGSTDAAPASSH